MSDTRDNQGKPVTQGRMPSGQVAERFRRTAERRLLELVRGLLDSADTGLMARVDATEDLDVYTAHHALATELRRKRFTIEQRLVGLLGERIDRLFGEPSSTEPEKPDLSMLDLVSSETLERDLAVEAIVGKARNANKSALAQLVQRLSLVAPVESVDGGNNPVDPRQLGEMLKQALELVEASSDAWLSFFALFEQRLLPQLPDFYRELNRMLADAGLVLPGRAGRSEPRARRQAGDARASNDAAGAAGPGSAAASDAGDALIQALASLIRSVADGDAGAVGGFPVPRRLLDEIDAEEGDEPGLPASVTDVVAVLSTLQQMPREAGNDASVYLPSAAIRQQVRQGLATGAGGERMEPLHACAIEIVSLVFESVLEHPDIPQRMKLLLSELQIPVVKVALLDPALFSQRSHPARRLINELARAATTWSEVDGREDEPDPLLQCMEGIVHRIHKSFSDDITVFAKELDTFEDFRAGELQRVRQVEARTRAVAEGKARLSDAQQRAAREIRERCVGQHVPAAVRDILQGPWMRVLSMTLLREGDGSDVWKRHLLTVERLLATVQMSSDHEERRDLVLKIPGLLKDLRGGANAIMFDQARMSALLDALEAAHIDVLTRPLDEAAAPAAEMDLGLPPDDSTVPNADLEPFLEAVDGLPVDSWLEWRHEGEAPVRCRLAARFSNGAWLVLVNRAGFRMAELPRRAMAEELASGRLRQLDDAALFDQALTHVVTELRQQVSVA